MSECRFKCTYIVAERNEVDALVVSEESQSLVQTPILVGARVLRRDQVEIGHLELVESIVIAHLREEVLQVLGSVVFNFDREEFALSVVPERGDSPLFPDSIFLDLALGAAERLK